MLYENNEHNNKIETCSEYLQHREDDSASTCAHDVGFDFNKRWKLSTWQQTGLCFQLLNMKLSICVSFAAVSGFIQQLWITVSNGSISPTVRYGRQMNNIWTVSSADWA